MVHILIKYNAYRRQMAALIHKHTGLAVSQLLTLSFEQLGLHCGDLFDIILAVEKSYAVVIPDEVPLNSLDDFVHFIQSQHKSKSSLALA